MKAIQITAPGKVEIVEKPMPVLKEGEALLRILYGGICGSDLSSYHGTNVYMKYPGTPGHEFSAEVVQLKGEAEGIKIGDIVTANPYFNCGKCYSCRRGIVNACMHNETMGVQRNGAFSEYIAMPVERLISGKGLDAQTLALIEPFCIGRHGVSRANVQPGDKVLVVGAGTIGLMAALAAKEAGGEVYLTDVAAQKLLFAEKLGFAGTILNDGADALDKAKAAITGDDGFDVTVEAVGLPSCLQNCLDMVAFGGRTVVIGVGKRNIDLDFTILQRKEINLFGSRNALTKDFEYLIDSMKANRGMLDGVVSKVYPFEEAPAAFEDLHQNGGSLLKVMVKF